MNIIRNIIFICFFALLGADECPEGYDGCTDIDGNEVICGNQLGDFCDCNGNTIDECGNCSNCNSGYCLNLNNELCTPKEFLFESSTQQAAYFFLDVTLDQTTVSSEDWVGAFNEGVCVGSRKWDTSQCGNNICEVPVLGDDNQLFTTGYMSPGQIPSFKIFKASDQTYIDATASEEIPWNNIETPVLDLFEGCSGYDE